MNQPSPTTQDLSFLLLRAAEFAAVLHTDQRRKGARAEPYINHPIEVARLIAQATEGTCTDAIIAALLHDTVEDTAATLKDVAAAFGDEIAAIVAEVTDDKSLPKAERKKRQVESAAAKSYPARLVKLADKISNLQSMQESPPAGWPLIRRREYFLWTRAVVDRLRGTNAELETRFDCVYAAGMAALDTEEGSAE